MYILLYYGIVNINLPLNHEQVALTTIHGEQWLFNNVETSLEVTHAVNYLLFGFGIRRC